MRWDGKIRHIPSILGTVPDPNARRGGPALQALWRRRPYAVAVTIVLVVLALPFMARRPEDWHTVYLPAGKRLIQGFDLYDIQASGGYTYPPAMAWLVIPVVWLPAVAARAVWYLVSAAAIVMLWRSSWQLTGGSPLEPPGQADGREHFVFLLGTLFTFRYVTDALDHQQNDLLVAALVVTGCAAMLLRGRDVPAGVLLGLAAGIKATPAIWVVLLLLRKAWMGAVAMALAAIAINLPADLFSSPPEGGLWLASWLKRLVLPAFTGQHGPGLWYTDPLFNQSLSGTLRRLLTLDWSYIDANLRYWPKDGGPSMRIVKVVIFGAQTAVLIATVAAMGWGGRLSRPAAERSNLRWQAPACGLLLAAMVLLSPASSKPHFVVLILPAFVLARRAAFERNTWAAAMLGAGLALTFASNRTIVGRSIGLPGLWLGGVTWSAMALWLGCLGVLIRPAVENQEPVAGAADER